MAAFLLPHTIPKLWPQVMLLPAPPQRQHGVPGLTTMWGVGIFAVIFLAFGTR